MGKWKQEKQLYSMEYSFDFGRYIEEQLREIDDLDERKYAKRVLVEGLGQIIQQTEQKYRQLEERVYQEIALPNDAYSITLTVIDRKVYDPTNDTLFPVIPLELQEEKLRETMSNEEEVYVGTVFMRASCKQCRQWESREHLRAALQTGEEEKQIWLICRKASRYLQAIEELYAMFQNNHIPWNTVNLGYLDKFYDFYVPKEVLGKGEISWEQLDIDFGEEDSFVQRDRIPLWNLKPLEFSSQRFMVPCIEGVYYEHELVIEEGNQQDGYLVESNKEILGIRREQGKIVLKSTKEIFEDWKAVQLVQKPTLLSLDYQEPLLTNRKKDSFVRRFAAHSGVNLLTKAELFRKITDLDINEYLQFIEYELAEHGEDFPIEDTMNRFLPEEIFPLDSRKVLLLTFKENQEGFYLNDSILWYVISYLQTEFKEYRLVGRIKDTGEESKK